ncbi:MAG TPA: MBL fold metallo-hydrolase [Polyangiaceae bacterium]|nr:MBL fold metallo-hydrolase [Polyangiaceae bacterium]
MRVAFHGVRGSVPAPGPSTARYGGNTSCVEVRLSDDSLLVLDAGTGLRELGNKLISNGSTPDVHLLLSHAHWDHILGLPFFGPLWRKDTRLFIYPLANDAQERFQRTIFDDIHFPVSANDIPAKLSFERPRVERWSIGPAEITRIKLNHPGGAQGFRIDDSKRSVVYLTDNELTPSARTAWDELLRFAHGADVLIHDSQYLPSDMPHKRGWGHSIVDDVLELGRQSEIKQLVLFHHDPDRDDAALDVIGENARAWMAERAPEVEVVVAREGLVLT